MSRKRNPIKAYFYIQYLELFEFGTALDVKMFDIKLYSKVNMLPALKKLAQEAKYQARFCENKVSELKMMYSLSYTDGYEVMPSKTDRFCYYEKLDPLRKMVAQSNLCLFSSAKDHQETIVIERGS